MPKAKAVTKPTKQPTRTPAKQLRGLAAADPETRSRVAAAGGAKIAKKKGHMAAIGAKGGANSHRTR